MLPIVLTDAVGTRLERVRRMHYVFAGKPDEDFGPVEVEFGGRTLLFDNEPDGETLRVGTAPWVDPFVGPLTPENQEFVRKSGKWTAFDVSSAQPWVELIGLRLSEVVPRHDPSAQKTIGVELRFECGGVIALGVMADELFVDRVTAPG